MGDVPMTLEELFARCKCGVYLTVNQHRDYYQTIPQYLAELVARGDQLDADEAYSLMGAENLFELHFYPDTPIGSYCVYGPTLESVLALAAECLK